MTDVPKTTKNVEWSDVILEEDVRMTDKVWRDITERHETLSVQFRLKSMWTGASGEALSPKWVMATMSPDFNEDGSLKAVTGTMSDITGFKFAESVNQARVDEAIEAKRQQENFIDMTSHEIRNPLGAVVHCADSISDSLSEMRSLAQTFRLTERVDNLGHLFELIESSTDAIATIASCTVHQKRIVDDILVSQPPFLNMSKGHQMARVHSEEVDRSRQLLQALKLGSRNRLNNRINRHI